MSIATPFLHVQYALRWFAWPKVILTAPMPIAGGAVTVLRSLADRQDYRPFFLAPALSALRDLASACIPKSWQSISIWQAASPETSQVFILVGVAVLVPLIPGYTAWIYWYFAARSGPRAAIIDAFGTKTANIPARYLDCLPSCCP